jgi:DNA-binding NtrC family response regulator
LWPPRETLQGKAAQARRQIHGATTGWWDVEFFPLVGPDGLLCILGRITGPPLPPISGFTPFPDALSKLRDQHAKGLTAEKAVELWSVEKLVEMREQHARRFRLGLLDSPLPGMRRVVEQARLAASIAKGVYIVGESGIGKTWLARAIHQSGAVRERAFACLECARLPSIAISDVLFGGAGLLRRPGIGTLYLKEPSRLPQDVQLRLHEWLEQTAADDAKAGPHIMAGSVAAPLAEVHSGQLLEKLYASLATLVIDLPPLRQRMADLAELVDRLLDRHNDVNERQVTGLTTAAWELLREYNWPGNLRELNTTLGDACAHASSDLIDVPDLSSRLRQAVTLNQTASSVPDQPMPLDSILEQVERRLIGLALRRSRGNKTRAAEILGVWRPRLLRRMEALGMEEKTEGRGQRTEDNEESQGSADT